MKIYSWNTYTHNKRLDEIVDFIQEQDFDVVCLQEVSNALLDKLQQLPGGLVFSIDHTRVDREYGEDCYLVILTRGQIVSSRSFLVSKTAPQPLRTRLFVKLMKVLGTGWAEKILDHHALCADIALGDERIVRMFSTHLRHNGPSERIRELSQISSFFSEKHPNIICGDFNTIYNPWLNIFNWIMGAPVQEAAPWRSETKVLEKFFKNLKLKNPLESRTTHTFLRSQLDHIIIPQDWEVVDATVFKTSYGSDHFPISLNVNQ